MILNLNLKRKIKDNHIKVLDNYIKLSKLGKVLAKVYIKVEGTIINTTIKKYSNNIYRQELPKFMFLYINNGIIILCNHSKLF